MKNQNNNGTTAAKVNERAQQYDEITKVIRISFEHDGRMEPDRAREYVAARVIGYTDHTHTIDEGTRIMDVEDMGEPEPVPSRPTFAEAARDEVESHYNNGDSNDETAQAIAKAISRAVADIYGKGSDARYILDSISYHVQGHCNPALNDDEEEEEDNEPARLLVVFSDESQYSRARDFYCLKASEAPTGFFAEEYNDDIRALYFTEEPDTLNALEHDLNEELKKYGFTSYHFEQD